MFAYSNNGMLMWSVANDYVAREGEVIFDHYASDEELKATFPGYANAKAKEMQEASNADTIRQITDLEEKAHRSHRDITLAMLQGNVPDATSQSMFIDYMTQISLLRSQLK